MDHGNSDQGQNPMVSVVITTYQHAPYIEKCLEGVLSQRTTFSVEILVGEDDSTDGTREICRRFADAYPDRIRLFLRDRKDVMIINGRPTGRANFLDLLKAARGQFVALCEGDDHWIDPEKLQRQISAMERDPLAAACFTDAYNELEGLRTPFMNAGYANAPEGVVDQRKIIEGQGIPTCTFVYRKVDLEPIEKVLRKSPVADTILFSYLSGLGHFIYQSIRTGVRVLHPGGVYSLRSALTKLNIHLCTLPFMDQVTGGRHTDLLAERRRKILDIAWSEAITTHNRELAKFVWPLIRKERQQFGWNFTTTLRNFFKAYWPLPDKLYAKITGK